MKPSIVIPVKTDTKNNHKELLYALRSLEKNLKGFVDIWVIGEKIKSLEGLKYIECKDEEGSKWKERNIYRKIMKAIEHPEVTEDFIFTNDDIFLTQQFDVNDLPYYYKSTLEETMAKNALNNYRKSLNHTRKVLRENGKPEIDFDTHFPIIYNKKKFLCTFENINWDLEYGYVIKSLYCGKNDIVGEYGGDCKIQTKMNYNDIKAKIGDRGFFSTSDASMNEDMIKLLEEMYQTPSKYEK